ncbi:hypothetical protein RRG08_065486 [Elysia crispata]|uniref:Uncharacterized protein n=1 Tax=Elysia crispata TaxID=231223 RepID=A0AAE1ASH2_9GAST|nr:hypothetical protein RRG08_065486 [Elysia crispata]
MILLFCCSTGCRPAIILGQFEGSKSSCQKHSKHLFEKACCKPVASIPPLGDLRAFETKTDVFSGRQNAVISLAQTDRARLEKISTQSVAYYRLHKIRGNSLLSLLLLTVQARLEKISTQSVAYYRLHKIRGKPPLSLLLTTAQSVAHYCPGKIRGNPPLSLLVTTVQIRLEEILHLVYWSLPFRQHLNYSRVAGA